MPCRRSGEEEHISKVTSEISMSLDGFIAGPNVRVGNGMGDGGDRLHDWMFDAKTGTDAIPILLGGGVRLFEDLDPEGIELRRKSSIETPGAPHLRFEFVR